MIAGLEDIGSFAESKACPHRQTATERLCRCEDIRGDTIMLEAERFSRPSKSTLNLIEDKKHIVLIAERAESFQE